MQVSVAQQDLCFPLNQASTVPDAPLPNFRAIRQIAAATLPYCKEKTWWRHQMETFSTLPALCVPGEFLPPRPVSRSFGVFFDLRLNKRLGKHSWGWWFKTLSHALWRHCNELSWKLLTLPYMEHAPVFDNWKYITRLPLNIEEIIYINQIHILA